jgi:spermidine synthase
MEEFIEKVDDVTIIHKGELVYREKTPHQLIEIFDSAKFGRVLKLDDEIQLSTFDEELYHTQLINKDFINKERIQTALVIGGGDGGAIRELCRTNVKKIVLAELDEKVIEACKRYLPTVSMGAFDDAKVEVVIGDAFEYIKNTDMQYDLVVSDLPDCVEPDFETLSKAVSEGGYFICQHGTGLAQFNMEELARRKGLLHNLYQSADFFGVKIPSLVYGDMVFSFSRK